MNELISVCLDKHDTSKLSVFPRVLLSEFERELIDWILDYERRYGEIPTAKRIRKVYPTFVPLPTSGGEVLDDVYDSVVDRLRKSYLRSYLGNLELRLNMGEDPDMEAELLHMLTVATDIDHEFARYTTFDRNLYFRSGGVTTGLKLIDKAIGNLCNGDFALIVGRLGSMKSTMAEWFTVNWLKQGLTVLYVSKEMLAADVFARIDAFIGHFNPLDIRRTKEVEPKLRVLSHIASSSTGEIIIPSRAISTPEQIREIALKMKVDTIVIDGVHLMFPSYGKARGARWERIADVSNEIKQLSLSLAKPVVGISQLKRVGAKEAYDPEDIAYSDALGQDADFVMSTRILDPESGRTEVKLLKNRFGPEMGTIVRIDFSTMTVVDESIDGRVDDSWD